MNSDIGPLKFGNVLPIPAAPVEALLKIAVRSEEAGFDSVWASDHLLMVPGGLVPNALSLLPAAAALTKRVLLGTAVSDVHRYHPAVLAQMAATIDHISGGRFILGLGAGEAMNLDPFGIEHDRPVARTVEAIGVMRSLWAGDVLECEGLFWRFQRASLQIRPVGSSIPIYLGANSPRTRRLAGALADGWLPTPRTPELYKKHLGDVLRGAREAGRSPEEIERAIFIYTAVAEEAEDAHRALKRFKPLIIHSVELLREAGFELEPLGEAPEQPPPYHEVIPGTAGEEAFWAFGRSIPLEAAVEFSISGTVDDCMRRIEEFARSGVEHFVLVNVGPDAKRTFEAYARHIIPYFREAAGR